MPTLDVRCRSYCACEKCCAYPLKQPNCNWTRTQLDRCRFSQFKEVIQREVRMLSRRTPDADE